ncbi:MAG: protein translocase subunit SecF [Candidatus Krumholzibacteriota bacterium]|nr:protein translocase subunit SecF [Candidatus Krumholzibacteriota bacterium]
MFQILANTNFRIIPIRRLMMSISLVVILIGVASLVLHGGPNLGIDFKGGYKFIVEFERPVDLGQVRSTVRALGFESARVSDFGSANEVIILLDPDAHLAAAPPDMDADAAGDAIQVAVADGIRAAFTDNTVVEISQEKVGPKIGSELRTQGLWAILYSLLGIVIYISWRFEFKFAIAAIVALVHDVLITLGIFSLLGKEIDLTILGALLTIVGYSLNDTIVVFDRIRENLQQRRRGDVYEEVVNASVNQTLSRTIITSLTTLIVVLILYFLGGAVIRDFAFALVVGVVVGTYSSIFIASPILVEWQGANQRRRNRRLATT